jgi:hypothetical protein
MSLRSAAAMVEPPTDWRQKSKPIKPGSTYPAKDHCRHVLHLKIPLQLS